MSNKKQSSVEWAMEQMHIATKECNSGLSDMPFYVRRDRILKQAKAMHRQETESFGALCCLKTTQKNKWSLEQLYNEIYGGGE